MKKIRRKVKVKDFSDILRDPHDDEILFSIMDPELLSLYYREKYGE